MLTTSPPDDWKRPPERPPSDHMDVDSPRRRQVPQRHMTEAVNAGTTLKAARYEWCRARHS